MEGTDVESQRDRKVYSQDQNGAQVRVLETPNKRTKLLINCIISF